MRLLGVRLRLSVGDNVSGKSTAGAPAGEMANQFLTENYMEWLLERGAGVPLVPTNDPCSHHILAAVR